jgi:hypothetical protein
MRGNGRYGLQDHQATAESLAVHGIPSSFSGIADTSNTCGDGSYYYIPAGYNSRQEVQTYAQMGEWYIVRPQDQDLCTLLWWDFQYVSCGPCAACGYDCRHWVDAMGEDLGEPDSIYYELDINDADPDTSELGLDGAMFRRDYSNEDYIVLYRPQYYWRSSCDDVLGDSNFLVYDPPDLDTLWVLRADGEFGDAVMACTLYNCTALIFTTSNPGGAPPDNIEINTSSNSSFGYRGENEKALDIYRFDRWALRPDGR